MVLKSINILFLITTLIFVYRCSIGGKGLENKGVDSEAQKYRLQEEVKIYIDYLSKIEGEDTKQIILVSQYSKYGINYYYIENAPYYITNFKKEFYYDDYEYSVEKEVSLDAFKILNNTLICLYNNSDFPNAEHNIGKIPEEYNYVSYAIKNQESLNNDYILENIHGDYFHETLKIENNKICLYDTSLHINTPEFLKFRREKLKSLNLDLNECNFEELNFDD